MDLSDKTPRKAIVCAFYFCPNSAFLFWDFVFWGFRNVGGLICDYKQFIKFLYTENLITNKKDHISEFVED